MMLWVLLAGGVVAMILAWALGANDVANAFGTSVGAKVLTLRQAIMIAAVVEFLGGVLLSNRVSDTFRNGIYNPAIYADNPQELMVGMFSSLVGSTMWLIIATFVSMPVSSTHSAVGAVLGFTLTAKGLDGVDGGTLLFIAASWFLSPILAGSVSMFFYVTIRHVILRRRSALRRGLLFSPFFYGSTIAFITAFVVYEGSPGLQLHDLPTWLVLSLSLGLGAGATVLAFLLKPFLRTYIENKFHKKKDQPPEFFVELPKGITMMQRHSSDPRSNRPPVGAVEESTNLQHPVTFYGTMDLGSTYTVRKQPDVGGIGEEATDDYTQLQGDGPEEIYKDHFKSQVKQWIKNINKEYSTEDRKNRKMYSKSEVFDPKVEELFSFLQILTAMAGGLAHGANDISNAIASYSVIYSIWVTDGNVLQNTPMPMWIVFVGSLGMILGLAMWGYRVMKTIGEDLTKVTPSRGFNIELGSALTVLFASRAGMPVSTTHCKVGSVVGVGLIDSKKAVNWQLFISVGLAWVITLPVSGFISSITFLFFEYAQAF